MELTLLAKIAALIAYVILMTWIARVLFGKGKF